MHERIGQYIKFEEQLKKEDKQKKASEIRKKIDLINKRYDLILVKRQNNEITKQQYISFLKMQIEKDRKLLDLIDAKDSTKKEILNQRLHIVTKELNSIDELSNKK